MRQWPRTSLEGEGAMLPDKPAIGGVMRNDHLARINILSVPDRPGVAAALLAALGERQINVQFIVQCIDPHSRDHIVLCVDRGELEASRDALQIVVPDLRAEQVVFDSQAASISIYGPDFRERPGIAATMFQALASRGINILAISTSISTVTCIIDQGELGAAEAAIREAFVLPR
jgi:aspartate kinase